MDRRGDETGPVLHELNSRMIVILLDDQPEGWPIERSPHSRCGDYKQRQPAAKHSSEQHLFAPTDREAAGLGSDRIVGGHAASLPPAAVGMNASHGPTPTRSRTVWR